MRTQSWLPIGLFGLLIFSVIFSVSQGAMTIAPQDTVTALWSFLSGHDHQLAPHIPLIIQDVRLPRTLLCIVVGSLLALCGAVMQGLFRNPLADPGIIGISAGAALGAACAIVLFGEIALPLLSQLSVPVFAFFGGAITTLLVYRLGRVNGVTSVSMMLLAGVAVGALAGGALGLLNYIADDQALRDLSLWTMGSMAGATWSGVGLGFIALIVLFTLFYRDANRLNALLLGEAEARHSGINVQALKRRLIWLTAAGVGITVSLAGMVGFIGLIIPHLIRLCCGPNHRVLLPLSALGGALLLVLADLIARTIAAPLDMPVGIITAAIGAPFFLWLLISQRGRLS